MNYTNFAASTSEDVLGSVNLGQDTLTTTMPLSRFVETTDVANASGVVPDEIAQRELDRAHAIGLAVYILKGVIHATRKAAVKQKGNVENFDRLLNAMGDRRHYSLQPVVVSLPASLEELKLDPIKDNHGTDVAYRVSIPFGMTMWVVDGQHRRFAMTLLLEFLTHVLNTRTYPRKGSLYPVDKTAIDISPEDLAAWRQISQMARACQITVEIHLGLTVEEQRQLFHDLNNLGKRVSAGTSFDFDSSNPVNNFIKAVLLDEGVMEAAVAEKDITDWAQHDGSVARKDLVAVNAILFLNKTNARTATPLHVAHMEDVARRFWQEINSIPGFGESQAKLKTVAAQPVVLKALAKLAYDFARGRKADELHLNQFLDGLAQVDFSHENPMWDYYSMTSDERGAKLAGLTDYMPGDHGNRDIGARDDDGKMRFGAKHNDIFPIIGDMVRWRLSLPSRHASEDVQAA